jgi:hypothetical protein
MNANGNTFEQHQKTLMIKAHAPSGLVHAVVRQFAVLVGRGGIEPPYAHSHISSSISGTLRAPSPLKLETCRQNRPPQERCPHRQNDCFCNSFHHVTLLD